MKLKLPGLLVFLLIYCSAANGEFISPEDFQKVIKKQDNTAIVDIRNRQYFNCYHIEGALNIPSSSIKNKDFLKTKQVKKNLKKLLKKAKKQSLLRS